MLQPELSVQMLVVNKVKQNMFVPVFKTFPSSGVNMDCSPDLYIT